MLDLLREERRKEMSYNDAYEIIALWSNESLVYFADHWERWPVGDQARHLIEKFRKTSTKLLHKVADEIEKRNK